MKPGDRVRVTLGDSAVVGEVVYTYGFGRVDVRADGAADINAFWTPPWTVELLPEPVPAWMLEPGAVCMDKDGVAWQRSMIHADRWYADGWDVRDHARLIAEHGPLTRLVPVPVVPEDVLDAARWLAQRYEDNAQQYRVARWVLDLAGQQ